MRLRHIALAAALSLIPTASFAEYPDRTIQFVVPYTPGGGVDVIARALTLIHERPGDDLSLERLAAASAMSRA